MCAEGPEHLTAWLNDARGGDQRAFERLFAGISSQRCLLKIMSSLPVPLRARVDTDDVLQEVLQRAWRDIGQLHAVNTAGFHRWMAGIARHVVVETVRGFHADRRDVDREERFQRSPDSIAFGHGHTPSQSAARREQAAKIARLLDELKEPYRDVIVCRILDGHTTKETAQKLEMSPENVRVALCRTLAKLRELLARHGIKSTLFRPL